MTDTSDKSGVPSNCHHVQLSLRSDSDGCATSSLCCKSDNVNDTEVKRIAGDGAFSCENLSGEILQNVDNKRTTGTAGTDTTDAVPSTPQSPLPPERCRVDSGAVSESDPSFIRRDVHRSSTEPDQLNKKNPDTEVTDTNLVASTSALALRESGDDERYDVFMIYSEDDETNARIFVNIIEKFLRPSNGRNRFFRERNLGEDLFDYQEKGLEQSRLKFIFLDKNSDDKFNEFLIHRALHRMIKQRDRQSVVPVKARHAVNVPGMIELFYSLDIQRLLRGHLLDDITDVNNLTRSDLDENVLSNIKKKLDQETT